MEIHILLEGEQLGPFSEIQVRQYLGEGIVSPSDLATYEGMEEWQSIDHVLANLANLPVSAPPTEAISPDVPPPEPPADASPQPPLTMHNNAPETLELASAPPTVEPVPPLTASQKTKRKLSKIVIQPILPLEATAPTKKRLRTGKTTLTLEPLRPTTALPPIAEPLLLKKKTKTGKTLIRTGQVSLRDIPGKPSANPKPTRPPVPVTPAAPANENELPPPVPFVRKPILEHVTGTSSAKAGNRRMPPEIIYTVAGFAFLIVCLIFLFFYLISAHNPTPPAANPENAPPSSHVDTQSPEAVPKTAADYSDSGFALQSKGDLDGAILDYNQAIDLDPKDVKILYRRGLARQEKGDLDGAIADYTRVLGLDSNQADAYSNRAFVKQSKGDLDGAIADYAQALLINPKISAAYYNEGLIEVQKGYLDGAIADYNHAIDLDPKMAVAYYNRGVAKNTEGNLDGAIADFTQALVLNPKIAHAYCDRGFARQSKGDPDGALVDYAQAIALNPKMTAAYYNRGLIKLQKGDLDGAVADNTEVIGLDQKNGQAYFRRGLALYGKGNLDEAQADLRKFCELAPRDGDADAARLYIWLISTEANPKGTADQELSTSLLNDWNSPPEEMTSKIAAFLLGHIHENDLIANAASPDPNREPGQYCKAWYFAGMKRLLTGDKASAMTNLQKSVATQQKDLYEYTFASAKLQALGQSAGIPLKPAVNP